MFGEGTRFAWEGITPSVVPRHAPSALRGHTVRMGRLSAAWKGSTQQLDPLSVVTSPPPAPQVPTSSVPPRVSSVPVGRTPAKWGGPPHVISAWRGHTQRQLVLRQSQHVFLVWVVRTLLLPVHPLVSPVLLVLTPGQLGPRHRLHVLHAMPGCFPLPVHPLATHIAAEMATTALVVVSLRVVQVPGFSLGMVSCHQAAPRPAVGTATTVSVELKLRVVQAPGFSQGMVSRHQAAPHPPAETATTASVVLKLRAVLAPGFLLGTVSRHQAAPPPPAEMATTASMALSLPFALRAPGF